MTGDLLGTLRYMAPEQGVGRSGLVDHRADIYSLGATLYELLTLQPILEGDNRELLLKQLRSEEPRSPRYWNSHVPADLATILLKAVAKDPQDRYDTAEELADDLQRFLRDEPILARPATFAQRMQKFVRRHPTGVLSAAVVLTMALVATSFTSMFLSAAYRQVSRQQSVADANLQLAVDTVEDLVATIKESDSLRHPSLRPFRRELFEKALGYYTKFIALRRDDLRLQQQLAQAYWSVGNINNALGQRKERFGPTNSAITSVVNSQRANLRNDDCSSTSRRAAAGSAASIQTMRKTARQRRPSPSPGKP